MVHLCFVRRAPFRCVGISRLGLWRLVQQRVELIERRFAGVCFPARLRWLTRVQVGCALRIRRRLGRCVWLVERFPLGRRLDVLLIELSP